MLQVPYSLLLPRSVPPPSPLLSLQSKTNIKLLARGYSFFHTLFSSQFLLTSKNMTRWLWYPNCTWLPLWRPPRPNCTFQSSNQNLSILKPYGESTGFPRQLIGPSTYTSTQYSTPSYTTMLVEVHEHEWFYKDYFDTFCLQFINDLWRVRLKEFRHLYLSCSLNYMSLLGCEKGKFKWREVVPGTEFLVFSFLSTFVLTQNGESRYRLALRRKS